MTTQEKQRLNELLAEHVMGWMRIPVYGLSDPDPEVEFWTWQKEDGSFVDDSDLPDFLTWEGMGMVVAKMKEKGYVQWTLTLNCDPKWGDSVYSSAFFINTTCEPTSADNEEAPIATGLAALKACGVEEVR